MGSLFSVLIVLLLMIGLIAMMLGAGGGLMKSLIGIIVILVLLTVFSDSILAILGPAISTLITWIVRIAAVIAALLGIGAIIRILRNR